VNTFHASRKVGIVTGVGDRRSEDIIAMGEEAASFLDEVIIRLDEDLRGRQAEDIRQLLQEGVRRVDAQKPVSFISNECAAAEYAINHAVPGSVVVILVENVKRVQELIHSCLEKSALQNMRTAV
jgi:cyanophycin synthetase